MTGLLWQTEKNNRKDVSLVDLAVSGQCPFKVPAART